MYMIRMDTSLAGTPNVVVMPVERPTVPKALVISNRASTSRSWGSKTMVSQVPVRTTLTAIRVMTAALRKAPEGME